MIAPSIDHESDDRLKNHRKDYRFRALAAMAALTAFVVLYFLLAGWFAAKSYHMFASVADSKEPMFGIFLGFCSGFLSLFMLKAVFQVKHGRNDDSIEICEKDQPGLFDYLHRLADAAKAPRPHRVFVSARVNAAVFYDLSLVNLIFPSRKNLEIGLGLVNVLSLGEFSAVLAHEFGHFAQRAMAVGRWVYIAQQIVAQLITGRDKLDGFLSGLSRIDIRIAWIGWLLSLIVWSIRSLVETAFRGIVIIQRALSREMEMEADLVAVSLTGSDALINALYRLQAADDAWERTLGFVAGEKGKERITGDVFAIQSEIVRRMSAILNDPHYAEPPLSADIPPANHRVFKAELAYPPRMWLTHPLNHEREENAKQTYVAAEIDRQAAWSVFDDAESLRRQVSLKLQDAKDKEPVPIDESLLELANQFEREHLRDRYRGIFLGRSPVRHAEHPDILYNTLPETVAPAELDSLYPPALSEEIERLRNLQRELGQLRALRDGHLTASDSILHHRGERIERQSVPALLDAVEKEIQEVENRLQEHDRLCRTLHLAAARQIGGGWQEYLEGLLAALHYASHSEADLRDAQGLLGNTYAVVTATRKVSSSGIKQLVKSANGLHDALQQVFAQRTELVLDSLLCKRIGIENWADALGELKIPQAAAENIGEWLKHIDSWVDQAAGSCASLRSAALEELLLQESYIAEHFRNGSSPDAAPTPTRIPEKYTALIPGQERKRQTRLDWWSRFQTADGWFPALARLGVAGGIVAAVLGIGVTVGSANLIVYNGLARPLAVRVGDARVDVAALSTASVSIDAGQSLRVETRTRQGEIVEQFDVDVLNRFTDYIYNVAGASPMVEWTATYGNASPRPEQKLGAKRWFVTRANTVFSEPPKSIQSKSGGGTLQVLSGLGDATPSRQLEMLPSEAERNAMLLTHLRWDPTDSRYAALWFEHAAQNRANAEFVDTRIKDNPGDILLQRFAQDRATPAMREQICAEQRTRSEAAPENADFRYLAIRCMSESPAKIAAFTDGNRRWPQHPWFAYASGYVAGEAGRWSDALSALEVARRGLPAMRDSISIDQARIMRHTNAQNSPEYRDLVRVSPMLKQMIALETGVDDSPELKAYGELARGNLDAARRLAQKNPEGETRILRLTAASDGATPEAITRALGLSPENGTDGSTIWASMALTMRMQRDASPFRRMIDKMPERAVSGLIRFIDTLSAGKRPEEAEQHLVGLTPELRGQGYVFGAVFLGQKAPKRWRVSANQLLFVSERPFFR